MPEAALTSPEMERRKRSTYHLQELVHLTEDGELLAGLEDLLVLGRMRPLVEGIDIALLHMP